MDYTTKFLSIIWLTEKINCTVSELKKEINTDRLKILTELSKKRLKIINSLVNQSSRTQD